MTEKKVHIKYEVYGLGETLRYYVYQNECSKEVTTVLKGKGD